MINVRASLLNRRRLNSNAKILMMGIDNAISRDSNHLANPIKRPTLESAKRQEFFLDNDENQSRWSISNASSDFNRQGLMGSVRKVSESYNP